MTVKRDYVWQYECMLPGSPGKARDGGSNPSGYRLAGTKARVAWRI